jgi:hypothetical protein
MSGGVKQFIHPQMTRIIADKKMEKNRRKSAASADSNAARKNHSAFGFAP